MKRVLTLTILLSILCLSCNRISQKAKTTINKTGETVGETATEFFEGVAVGVDKTLECDIVLSDDLKKKGLKTGTFSISGETGGENNNELTIYFIFEKDFQRSVLAKAYNKKGLEIGRSKITVSGTKDGAGYFDFKFDERTDIGVRNKIVIE